MSDRISAREYRQELRSIAEEAARSCRDGEIDSHEALCDWVHETLDGHQWVIYTGYNWDVLAVSENDGAYVENFGTDGVIADGSLNTAALAYAAMEADLWETLWRFEDFDPNDPDSYWVAAAE